jgi:hypothetical protein
VFNKPRNGARGLFRCDGRVHYLLTFAKASIASIGILIVPPTLIDCNCPFWHHRRAVSSDTPKIFATSLIE